MPSSTWRASGSASTRLLRAAKNRFGSTDEVGVLEMRGDGLAEVDDASRFFLESDEAPTAGSAVTIALEGTRPLAVEIQALSAAASYGSPRRATTGIDVNRVLMLIAVLARHAGLNLSGHDVYVNVAGGLRIDEPAADLADRHRARVEPARASGSAGHRPRRRGCAVGAPARRGARRASACSRRHGSDSTASSPAVARSAAAVPTAGPRRGADIREALEATLEP